VTIEPQVLDDPSAAAAERLAGAAARGGHVVITGGSTPRAAYERTAGLLDDWSGVELWFTDERCVAPEHEHSNFGMAEKALLGQIEPAAVHRMKGELGAHDGADDYEQQLGDKSLGLVLLGMGPDGHVASLFPGHPSSSTSGTVIAVRNSPKPPPDRISVTMDVINRSRQVWFCVSGPDKAEAVAKGVLGTGKEPVPAALASGTEATIWLVDTAAAADLPDSVERLQG
jgi:6-phosphogluconolactonase